MIFVAFVSFDDGFAGCAERHTREDLVIENDVTRDGKGKVIDALLA